MFQQAKVHVLPSWLCRVTSSSLHRFFFFFFFFCSLLTAQQSRGVNDVCVPFMAVVTSEPSAVPRSYGISGADQQRQGQAPGNSRQKETAGGAHHESGKPGPQSKHLTRTHSHTHTHSLSHRK